jgi:PKD repeat protein
MHCPRPREKFDNEILYNLKANTKQFSRFNIFDRIVMTGIIIKFHSSLISVCAVSLLIIMLMPVASAVQVRVNASHDARLLAITDNQTWQEKRNNPGEIIVLEGAENASTINIGETMSMNETYWGPAVVNLYDTHYRAIITWDTAAIPNEATITDATVSVMGHTKADSLGTYDSCIIDTNPINPMAYAGADYSRTTFTRLAPDITYNNFKDNDWNSFTLNSTGINHINKGGYTSFMLTHSADVDNASALTTWESYVSSGFEIRGMNYLAGAYTPYMTINYTLPVPAPVASFTTNTTSGTAPLTVQFNDTSTGSPTSWNWSFGDGVWYNTTTSGARNGTHTYTTPTTYTARLKVANAGGSSTTNPGTTITVSGTPPVVNGTTTVGIYRNNEFYLRNTNTAGNADVSLLFGVPGDAPLVGDWNGDGIDTVGIYRNNAFYLRNINTAGNADVSLLFGVPGDAPLVGDWNGL